MQIDRVTVDIGARIHITAQEAKILHTLTGYDLLAYFKDIITASHLNMTPEAAAEVLRNVHSVTGRLVDVQQRAIDTINGRDRGLKPPDPLPVEP